MKARRRKFTEAEVAAWRERIFADGLEDPVKVAVGEAVKDFGRPEDFTLWAWYANRIGVNSFLELYFEQKSIIRECRLRSPAEPPPCGGMSFPTRGGGIPYTGWPFSLHGGSVLPTRGERVPYTEQSACAEATADKKGFPTRVRRELVRRVSNCKFHAKFSGIV